MAVKTRIIRADDVVRGTWSGGSTAEYYSWPEGSAFARRDFIFSICSATVDLEYSTFTPYPEHDRVILSVSDGFALSHDGERRELGRLEPHAFTGEAVTESFGRYSDFNLVMRRSVCRGGMSSAVIAPGAAVYSSTGSAGGERIVTVYCAEGEISLIGRGGAALKSGDMLVLEGLGYSEAVGVTSDNGGVAVFCDVAVRKED